MEDLAADVVAVLDAEGVGQAHYCGSSLGGMVGFALALEHRSRLASVTFLATQGRLPTANGERLRATAKRLAGGTMAPVAEETLARYTTEAWRRANPDRHAALVAMASGNPAAGYAHSGEAIIAMDYDGRLGDISTPTLVVAGEHDMPTPPERMALYLEGIAGARMATIAEAGHFPNWGPARGVQRRLRRIPERGLNPGVAQRRLLPRELLGPRARQPGDRAPRSIGSEWADGGSRLRWLSPEARMASCMYVATVPGAKPTTFTPAPPYSRCAERVSIAAPAFAAQ